MTCATTCLQNGIISSCNFLNFSNTFLFTGLASTNQDNFNANKKNQTGNVYHQYSVYVRASQHVNIRLSPLFFFYFLLKNDVLVMSPFLAVSLRLSGSKHIQNTLIITVFPVNQLCYCDNN